MSKIKNIIELRNATSLNHLDKLRSWESESDFASYCVNAELIALSIKANESLTPGNYEEKFLSALEEYNLTLEDGLKATSYMAYIDTSFGDDSEEYNFLVMKLHNKELTDSERLNKRWILNFVFSK